MSEVLSQNQIDALLTAITSGEVQVDELRETPKKVKIYDFKRPNKFSKNQTHTLQIIYENYARNIGTLLSGLSRQVCNIEVISVDQIPYDEFVKSVPASTVLGVFTMPPLEGSCLYEINNQLAFSMIDRLLGGKGLPLGKNKTLTEIEEKIIENTIKKLLMYFHEPWESIIEIEPNLERIETNTQFVQIVSPNEMVVVISLEVKLGETYGMINICMPFLVLEPIVNNLNTNYYYSTSEKTSDKTNMEVLKQRISNNSLQLRAVLGTTSITVNDLLMLTSEDVIKLNRKVSEPIDIYIGNHPKFLGLPGTRGKHLGIQILETIEEDAPNE